MADPSPRVSEVRAVFSPDGSAYKGTWLNSLRHGQGIHVYPNGDVYHGEWVYNHPHGYGDFYTRADPKLAPQAKKRIPEDPAAERALRLTYAGYWERGDRTHFGKYFYAPTERYEGNWRKGLRNGFGVHFYPDTVRAEHVLLSREEHAKALYRVRDNPLALKHLEVVSPGGAGDAVDAVDAADAACPAGAADAGAAALRVRNAPQPYGVIYKGHWLADMRHGLGRVLYANGDVFVGAFESDHAYGIGVRYHVHTRMVHRGFYDARGMCVCGETRSGFDADDLRVVFCVWSEPCAPFVGISEAVRHLLRASLDGDRATQRLRASSPGGPEEPGEAEALDGSAVYTAAEDPGGVDDAHRMLLSPEPRRGPRAGSRLEPQILDTHSPPSAQGAQGAQTAQTAHPAARSLAEPVLSRLGAVQDDGVFHDALRRVSSRLSETVGQEFDALQRTLDSRLQAPAARLGEPGPLGPSGGSGSGSGSGGASAGRDSALSFYAQQEYPYVYQPDDDTFDVPGLARMVGNILGLSRLLPIRCAPARSPVDQLLNLPYQPDSADVPALALLSPDQVIVQTLKALVGL